MPQSVSLEPRIWITQDPLIVQDPKRESNGNTGHCRIKVSVVDARVPNDSIANDLTGNVDENGSKECVATNIWKINVDECEDCDLREVDDEECEFVDFTRIDAVQIVRYCPTNNKVHARIVKNLSHKGERGVVESTGQTEAINKR